jgi:hypothetical protein
VGAVVDMEKNRLEKPLFPKRRIGENVEGDEIVDHDEGRGLRRLVLFLNTSAIHLLPLPTILLKEE